MYGLLAAHGIKPWEFGELTWPWLINILRKGKTERAAADQVFSARRALALAKSYAGEW